MRAQAAQHLEHVVQRNAELHQLGTGLLSEVGSLSAAYAAMR
ncbi:MAG: hypothetical protein JWQ90_4370 [Hydrocarboniphaga sp.]|nr:hypothetical protein [Hydrocarboniphaga sp.]